MVLPKMATYFDVPVQLPVHLLLPAVFSEHLAVVLGDRLALVTADSSTLPAE